MLYMMYVMCDLVCMDVKDPAYEARGILKAVARHKSLEKVERKQTRDGWDDRPSRIENARKFIKKCRDDKANLSSFFCMILRLWKHRGGSTGDDRD